MRSSQRATVPLLSGFGGGGCCCCGCFSASFPRVFSLGAAKGCGNDVEDEGDEAVAGVEVLGDCSGEGEGDTLACVCACVCA